MGYCSNMHTFNFYLREDTSEDKDAEAPEFLLVENLHPAMTGKTKKTLPTQTGEGSDSQLTQKSSNLLHTPPHQK